jgi:hypothetical protein
MRTLLALAAAAIAVPPSLAAAQLAPRSLALEIGLARDSGAALRAPLSLSANWWIAERLDLTARVGWASVARTSGRAPDSIYEGGVGLRRALGDGPLRPSLMAEVAAAHVLGAWPFERDLGVRLRAGAVIDAFIGRDLAIGLALLTGGTLLVESGSADADLGMALRLEGFF